MGAVLPGAGHRHEQEARPDLAAVGGDAGDRHGRVAPHKGPRMALKEISKRVARHRGSFWHPRLGLSPKARERKAGAAEPSQRLSATFRAVASIWSAVGRLSRGIMWSMGAMRSTILPAVGAAFQPAVA